jgi:beta-lactamase class A
MNNFHRRGFLLAGAGLAASGAWLPVRAAGNFRQAMAGLEARLGGQAGLSALDTGNGRTLSWRGGERFAMCSSFKWLLAAAVQKQVEAGHLKSDQIIRYTAKALLSHSPRTEAHVKTGMTVDDLCAAVVEVSDNGGANLLLDQVGGPAGLTRFLRENGDAVTRLDRNEPTLNSNIPGDPRDTTTPDGMIGTMKHFLLGDALKPISRDKLLEWLRKNETGDKRLRAGLPKDWIVGDKTGTGTRGATVDDAIAWPPGRKPILIAAYLSGSTKPIDALEAGHAEMGRLIAAAFAKA